MSVTGERIRERRIEMGLTVDQLAERVGKNRATVYRYEGDEIENMPLSIVTELAKVLQVSPSYLMGWSDSKTDYELPSSIFHPSESLPNRVPVIGEVAAGEPVICEEDYDSFVDAPGKADFALRVEGDSMEPTYQDGDIVYIRQQDDVEDGQVAVVLLDDSATMKHVYHIKNGLSLTSNNAKYPPKICTLDEYDAIRILGLAVGYTRMFNLPDQFR